MAEFVDANARLLNLLLEQKSLSASSVKSKSAKELFWTLEQTNVIQKRRKGAGNQYQLSSKSSLVEFINSLYPSGVYRLEVDNTPRRVQGILESQSSKSLNKLDFDLVTLRGSLSVFHDEKLYDLAELTSKSTFLSLKLSAENHPAIHQASTRIITVENPTAFTELESMVHEFWDMAIYTGGRMSNILLNQLKQWDCEGHSILHFGDYDFVGLLEFSRILTQCPKAELYLPPSSSSVFVQQYGNTSLLQKQVVQHKSLLAAMKSLTESKGKTQLIQVYELLQTTAKGLEQESLYK